MASLMSKTMPVSTRLQMPLTLPCLSHCSVVIMLLAGDATSAGTKPKLKGQEEKE